MVAIVFLPTVSLKLIIGGRKRKVKYINRKIRLKLEYRKEKI